MLAANATVCCTWRLPLLNQPRRRRWTQPPRGSGGGLWCCISWPPATARYLLVAHRGFIVPVAGLLQNRQNNPTRVGKWVGDRDGGKTADSSSGCHQQLGRRSTQRNSRRRGSAWILALVFCRFLLLRGKQQSCGTCHVIAICPADQTTARVGLQNRKICCKEPNKRQADPPTDGRTALQNTTRRCTRCLFVALR